jgi:hypothetical protein
VRGITLYVLVISVMKAVCDFYDRFLSNDVEIGQDQPVDLYVKSSIRKLKWPCMWGDFIRKLVPVISVMERVVDFYDGFLNND